MEMLKLSPQDVSIILLDAHPPGPYDIIFNTAFSKRAPMRRAKDLGLSQKRIRFEKAVFVPPGYSSKMFSELMVPSSCPVKSQLFAAFGNFVLQSFGISFKPKENKIRILFVSRKPYNKHSVEHHTINRQIGNEAELMEVLKKMPLVEATLIEFASLSYAEQLKTVAEHDIMIGMHGAGMTHLLWLPPWAGVVELWNAPSPGWRCYEHMSQWSGFDYINWTNQHPQNHVVTARGDVTTIDVKEFTDLVNSLTERIRKRKLAYSKQ
eukprot:TRINITY_DN7456_c0_g1_i4.p1 TRINITY_DN7456_c0_g1~~TRINITY_DN7456_c0_g1_i4.p1  ORF type:complete len:310 (+),score=14.72 TRINITY_DN7456_c0_g1_i4:137-931(+)